MKISIPSGKIKNGDVLVRSKTGEDCKVLETSKDEIAWFQQCDTGGIFGQCYRKTAPSIFNNVSE